MAEPSVSTSDIKQVKVDNWGIYLLQRLKHFFNRTDYCDLTLQFQGNAQLKVHRLVLSACTEYFELLERTCEMYEDCLVMPDDLQADVVVPIINFMYTGQLEFRSDCLEKLHKTSQVMNMPVLTKLLNSHRKLTKPALNNYTGIKRYTKLNENTKGSLTSGKRSYSKAFSTDAIYKSSGHSSFKSVDPLREGISTYRTPSPLLQESSPATKKVALGEARPSRYELPEELDKDNIFEDSFTNISYTSVPLMVHPETTKSYPSKRSGLFSEASTSKKFTKGTVDIIECRKLSQNDGLFNDDLTDNIHEVFPSSSKVCNQLFDQIMDKPEGPKVVIESKDKKASNLDHAKIISEVLKKYPHLVKSNKNIKLKILNTPNKKKEEKKPVKQQHTIHSENRDLKSNVKKLSFTYESDVLDSKEAAKLIALGADNINGPWICLICGTPGKAIHFTSYYNFRRHLVEVHHEKEIPSICEYCGLKSFKRNYMAHHLYTKHGIDPPPAYIFPKCNLCDYVALTEGFLVKHRVVHAEGRTFRCNVCPALFDSSKDLLMHIQKTGHKYSSDTKPQLQCVYCKRMFMREKNLYAHLKTNHKHFAKADGIIEDSDEDMNVKFESNDTCVKNEATSNFETECEDVDVQYEILPDGKLQLTTKKGRTSTSSLPKQKILNPGFTKITTPQKTKTILNTQNNQNAFLQDNSMSPTSNDQNEQVIMIDNNEYIVRDNQLISKNASKTNYIIPDMLETEVVEDQIQTVAPSTSIEYTALQTSNIEQFEPNKVMVKKSKGNQPIQIVVSDEEEYKALMSSNHHSIIFDDGETNKTLTVLTAPHNASLNTTTIDLDNSHSNDMMIMQNDYPINVTETVNTGNSNIVVVYSHSVDEQKQYQLLTPQALEAQFVQPSAIITQHYETVTTSTPVMSAHVIDTQTEGTWNNNNDQTVNIITSTEEMQTIEVIDHNQISAQDHQITNNENLVCDNLQELPPVQIISNQSNIINNEENQNVDHVVKENIISNNIITMETDITSQTIAGKDLLVVDNDNHPEREIISEELQNSNPEKQQEISSSISESSIINIQNEHVQNLKETVECRESDENIEEHVENIEESVENIAESVDNIEESVENIEESVENIEESVENIREHVENIGDHVDNVMEHDTNIEKPVNNVEKHVGNIEQHIENIDEHIAHENVYDNTEAAKNVQECVEGLKADVAETVEEHINKVPELESVQHHENIECMDNVQVTENIIESTEMIQETSEQANVVENISTCMEEVLEISQENTQEVNMQEKCIDASKQIQHLASEWSEDEDTSEEQQPNEEEMVTEIEESIENIEKEMKKQMSSTDVQSVSVENSPVQIEEQVTNVQNTREKISSLLNDWEDNDSQEESASPKDDDTPAPEIALSTSNVQSKSLAASANTEVAQQNDPIKSLVSDWDEEEEEK